MNVIIEIPLANAEGKTVKLEAIIGMGEVGITLPAMWRTPRVTLTDLSHAVERLEQLEEGRT